MAKSTVLYWNPLSPDQAARWEPLPDTDGLIEQLTLAIDAATGDYTRLTRFRAGADTTPLGPRFTPIPKKSSSCRGDSTMRRLTCG